MHSGLSLRDCFHEYTKEELINEYYCGKCKKHQRCSKRLSIVRLPDVLMLTLGRFSFDSHTSAFGRRRSKVSTRVSFPERLDLSQYDCGLEARAGGNAIQNVYAGMFLA